MKRSRSKGVRKVSRDLLLEFWDPSISRERFELETSKLSCRLSTGDTNDQNETLGQRGSGRGLVTYFCNFGTPSISREWFELETSNLACRLNTGDSNDKKLKVKSKEVWNGSRDLLLEFWDPLHISRTV